VPETKVRAGVEDGETAAGAVGSEMAAPGSALGFALNRALGRGMIGGARIRGFESHFFFLSGK
jgi:hypothetical protein